MPSKYRMILELASQTAKNITTDADRYTDFLITAANNYKYSFKEQLLIPLKSRSASSATTRASTTACGPVEPSTEKAGR